MITITHCTDTSALIAEVKEKYPDYESDGDFMITKKFKSFRVGDETLNRIRVTDEEYEMISQLENITCLGDYGNWLPGGEEIYNRLWEPGKIIDEETGQTKQVEFSRFSDEEY